MHLNHAIEMNVICLAPLRDDKPFLPSSRSDPRSSLPDLVTKAEAPPRTNLESQLVTDEIASSARAEVPFPGLRLCGKDHLLSDRTQ